MKEFSEDELELVAKALEHYHAYLAATQRQDARYKALADRLKRKGPEKERSEGGVKKKRA
jgi:hypothetical protein